MDLGNTEAVQDKDSLSPTLEKAIERGAELREEVIVIDDEHKEV